MDMYIYTLYKCVPWFETFVLLRLKTASLRMCFGGKCPVMWDLSSEQVLVDAFKLDA